MSDGGDWNAFVYRARRVPVTFVSLFRLPRTTRLKLVAKNLFLFGRRKEHGAGRIAKSAHPLGKLMGPLN